MGLERNYDPSADENRADSICFINDVLKFACTLNDFELNCVNVPFSEFADFDHDNVSCQFLSMVLSMHIDVPNRIANWAFGDSSQQSLLALDDAIIGIMREFELVEPLEQLWEAKCKEQDCDPANSMFDGYRKPWPYRPIVRRNHFEDSARVAFELRLDSAGAHVAPLFDGVGYFTSVSMPLRLAVKGTALELLAIEIDVDSGSPAMTRRTEENSRVSQFIPAFREPIVLTPLQREILAALDGQVLRKQPLADLLCKGHGSRFYKKGGITELMAMGLVARCTAGYYRPDAPPEGFNIGSLTST